MKNRTIFALSLCLLSAVASAESVTDAPLTFTDPNVTTVQADGNTKPAPHKQKKGKNEVCSAQGKEQNAHANTEGQKMPKSEATDHSNPLPSM
jgi:hypothetical protein